MSLQVQVDSAGSILTGGLNRAAGENVGVYGINQGDLALNSGNYDLSYQGNNLTITKALLNVIADAKTKVYGDADPSLTYQVSGLKNGDSAGSILTGGLNRAAGENVGVYGINQPRSVIKTPKAGLGASLCPSATCCFSNAQPHKKIPRTRAEYFLRNGIRAIGKLIAP